MVARLFALPPAEGEGEVDFLLLDDDDDEEEESPPTKT